MYTLSAIFHHKTLFVYVETKISLPGKLSAVLEDKNPLVDAVLTIDADGKCTISKWE